MNSPVFCLTRDDPNYSHDQQISDFCKGGAKFVQLRSKSLSMNRILNEGRKAVQTSRKHNACLILNDFIDLAKKIDADGVHLGSRDAGIQEARRILPEGKIIGKTIHSLTEAKDALLEKPDYVGLGPFRKSKTKNLLSPLLALEDFKQIVDLLTPIPVFLIGGLGIKDFKLIEAIGVRGLAMCQSLFTGDNVSSEVQMILKRADDVQSKASLSR